MRTRHRLPLALASVLLLSAVACDPDGLLETAIVTVGSPGHITVTGWAHDRDAPNTPVQVRIDVDFAPVTVVAASGPRPDVAAAQGIPDSTGFAVTVPATAGAHVVCVHALNVAGTDGRDTLIGCDFVTVADVQPVAHQLSLVEGTGRAPLSAALKWVISDPQGDRVSCRIDWDGGAWDDTIADCHSRIGAFHTYDTPGTYQVALEMTDGNSGTATRYRTATVTGTQPEAFDIQVRRAGGLTDEQFSSIVSAATRWDSVIAAGVPDVNAAIPADECASGTAAYNGTVDDLLIDVTAIPIDGEGGILAGAGPCYLRTSSGIPLYGVLFVDSADVAILAADGALEDTVLHEIGHVLGIGTLWRAPQLVGAGGSDPRYVGPMAAIAANEWFTGWTSVPVENRGGVGTADAHWRESDLGPELMTGILDDVNVLSAVSVGSLVDLGYQVDLRAADPLPRPSLRSRAASAPRALTEWLVGPLRTVG